MDKSQFRKLTEDVLCRMDLFSVDVVNLILATAAVETDFCKTLRNIDGPGMGFFNMTPKQFINICDKYLKFHKDIHVRVLKVANVKYLDHNDLMTNFVLQIIFIALHYTRVDKPFPKNRNEYAKFWKDHYNNKGSVHKFMNQYRLYVV
jgi:hypothetical protein